MPEYEDYCRQVVANAGVLAEVFRISGYDLVSGGTDNHLVLIDLTPKGISGLEAETALGRAGIAVNKNTVPFDKRGPRVTSGLRLGTPALTTRGMKEEEMRLIGGLINKVLEAPADETLIQDTRSQVTELCLEFPIYEFMDS